MQVVGGGWEQFGSSLVLAELMLLLLLLMLLELQLADCWLELETAEQVNCGADKRKIRLITILVDAGGEAGAEVAMATHTHRTTQQQQQHNFKSQTSKRANFSLFRALG